MLLLFESGDYLRAVFIKEMAMCGTTELEKSNIFADIEEDKDELEENKLVLEDC